MKSTERKDTITNEQLQAEFKRTGLTAAEIRKYSYDMISVNQAHQWLTYFERKEPKSMSIPTKVLLWKICQDKQNDLGAPSAPLPGLRLKGAGEEPADGDSMIWSEQSKSWIYADLGTEAKKIELKMSDTVLNVPWMCYPSIAKVTLAEGEFKVKKNKDGADKIGFRYRGTLFAGDYHGEGTYQLDCSSRVAVHIPNLRSGTFIIL